MSQRRKNSFLDTGDIYQLAPMETLQVKVVGLRCHGCKTAQLSTALGTTPEPRRKQKKGITDVSIDTGEAEYEGKIENTVSTRQVHVNYVNTPLAVLSRQKNEEEIKDLVK